MDSNNKLVCETCMAELARKGEILRKFNEAHIANQSPGFEIGL